MEGEDPQRRPRQGHGGWTGEVGRCLLSATIAGDPGLRATYRHLGTQPH